MHSKLIDSRIRSFRYAMNRDPTSTIAEAGLVFFYVQVHADKKKENEQM